MTTNNLDINWNSIYLGVKNNWLSIDSALKLLFNSSISHNYNDLLIELSVNQDDREKFLDLILSSVKIEAEKGLTNWEANILKNIEQSDQSIIDKLKEIELNWSRLNYPENWKEFIYYMPNEKTSSSEEVYQRFEKYLRKIG